MPMFRSDGLDLFYAEWRPLGVEQRATPVLLIHGFASTHAINWVNPLWIKVLIESGRRVIAFDNRGHGRSAKPHDQESYATPRMAEDARTLLDHLGLPRAHVIGYSMGARIAAFLARAWPERVRTAILGGLGYHLVDKVGLPQFIAEAMEAPDPAAIVQPMGRLFRRFADANGADLVALAACIRGSRQTLPLEALRGIGCPVLVAVGTEDPIAGDPHELARLFPRGRALDIPGRDHNLAVGDKVFKAESIAFLNAVD